MVDAYRSDVEYLEDQLVRLELLIEQRLAAKAKRSPNDLDFEPPKAKAPVEPASYPVKLAQIELRIADRLAATRQAGRSIAMERFVAEYGLNRFECDLLILALAPTLDLRFADLYDKVAYKYRGRTVDTALTILCETLADKVKARRYFMLDSNLIRHHLLLMERDRFRGEEDILNLELKLPRRVMNLLLGSDAVDESLVGFSKLIEPTIGLDQVILAQDTKDKVVRLVSHHAEYLQKRGEWGFDRVIGYGRGIILLFAGPPGTGKTMLANALAHRMGKRILLVNTDRLYDRIHTLESNIDNVFREAKLQNCVLFFDECEMLFADRRMGNTGMAELLTALERFDGVAILATNLAPVLDEAMDRRIMLRLDFEIPTPELREHIWKTHLPAEAPLAADIDVRFLAQNFEFTGGYIKNAVLAALHEVLERKDEPAEIRQADLVNASRLQLRHKLGSYTDRIVPQIGLDAVVLPAAVKEKLVDIVESTRHGATVFMEWGLGSRLSIGKGLAVLFQGSPGTGKSLSAEAVAYELAKNLYRVSLPAIVSKFVGETEKNIKAVFDAAREGQSVLFFDEADSLFSRRTAVAGALDRYANMEVNLLLQEMERFEGLMILATNLMGNLDMAFERRLAYRIVFPKPDAASRARIWRGLLPPQMPVAGLIDFEYLGNRYELSGGHIKNAVVRAAYKAAREKGDRRVMTTALLARAADEEMDGAFVHQPKFGFAEDARSSLSGR
jgi:SpoVK/Ycf46/Vps4 family AAA+-type ATPase